MSASVDRTPIMLALGQAFSVRGSATCVSVCSKVSRIVPIASASSSHRLWSW